MEPQKNSFAVPVAIIIAGAFIAVAVYFSNAGTPATSNVVNNPGTAAVAVGTADINIATVGSNDHIVGNPNAAVILVEYSDTECPFCKNFHTNVHKLIDKYGKDGTLAWVYRHFPLESLHKKAKNEAKATECAAKLGGNEKFWAYIDRLFTVTTSNDGLDPAQLPVIAKAVGLNEKDFNNCLLSEQPVIAKIIEDSSAEAIKAGGNGTPFSILISQKKFDGAKMKKSLEGIVTKYQIPPDFFFVSNDNMKVSVSGAMPYEVMEEFVKIFKAI